MDIAVLANFLQDSARRAETSINTAGDPRTEAIMLVDLCRDVAAQMHALSGQLAERCAWDGCRAQRDDAWYDIREYCPAHGRYLRKLAAQPGRVNDVALAHHVATILDRVGLYSGSAGPIRWTSPRGDACKIMISFLTSSGTYDVFIVVYNEESGVSGYTQILGRHLRLDHARAQLAEWREIVDRLGGDDVGILAEIGIEAGR